MRQEVKLTLDSDVPWCLPTLDADDQDACYIILAGFVADACSELNLRQANYLSSIFYLKFYTQ